MTSLWRMASTTDFDLVDQFGLIGLPSIVFVTAYQEHAIRAFDVQAIDYLTRPTTHTVSSWPSSACSSRRLDPELFLHLHRSAIVNLNYVREIFREGRGEGTVVRTNGSRIKLSHAGRRLLMERR